MPTRTLASLGRAVRGALALSALAGGTAAAQTLPSTLVFSGAGGTIGDNRTNRFSVTVDAPHVLPANVGVTVRLRGFVDALAGDLFADLTFDPGPRGGPTQTVRLFDFAPGGFFDARSFDGAYSFGSGFAAPLPGGVVKPGDFAAVGDLQALFAGQAVAGTYELSITDWFSNGGATLEGIDVAFDTRLSSVPEPGTWALLAGGLAALGAARARRRAPRR
jgi:hypothetical protein